MAVRSTAQQQTGPVHINPKFRPASPAKGSSKAHVNPKFANRPLPSVPDASPAPRLEDRTADVEPIYDNVNPVNLDRRKTDEFVKSIHQSVQSQVVMRNKYKKDNRTAKPPDKPIRHSIVEKSNRYSLFQSADAKAHQQRHSVYAVNSTATTPASTPTPALACQTPAGKQEGKENVPTSSTKKNFLFTPLRKTPFKKIGNRKLVRVKKKSLSPGTPKPSFKRIGNNKLIRIRESLSTEKSTPGKVYKIKTKTKIVKAVKNTPTNNSKYRFSFITPLSVRKNKLMSQAFSSKSRKSGGSPKKSRFTGRFKLDRRPPENKTFSKGMVKKASQTRLTQNKLKKLSGSTYHVSATKLQRVAPPSKPSRTTQIYRPKAAVLNPNLAANKLIVVQGVKFEVAENGRKLKRVPSAQSLSYSASVSQSSPVQSQTTSPNQLQTSPGGQTSPLVKASPEKFGAKTSPVKVPPPPRPSPPPPVMSMKKTYIGGEEFDEIEPGVFTRSRHSLTRQSITHAKNRSINTILKVQNRSKQYCMFYNKFGKCTKKEKGSCPYIHDAGKIAVCRRFLQGACTKEKCLLSHKMDPDKMPACKFFLEGVCTRENCPYLHVKVCM